MINRWNEVEAIAYTDPVDLRVYTSRLQGVEPDLVLHGGGNTSVKVGDTLYVKGSGWSLDTIERPGFSPVKMDVLLSMAEQDHLSDTELVAGQRAALLDEKAPNPSIEAVLHALIPFTFVDHTHADAVATISNTSDGEARFKEIYGKRVMIVPYVMPGFELAKTIRRMTQDLSWDSIEGLVLLNHGIFTFHADAKASYDKMIELVGMAEAYLEEHTVVPETEDVSAFPQKDAIARQASQLLACDVVLKEVRTPYAIALSKMANVGDIVRKGQLTPEHVIRTKPFPVIIDHDSEEGFQRFQKDYREYFRSYENGETMLDPCPRYAIVRNHGLIAIGRNEKEAGIIADIITHTAKAMVQAEQLGGWRSLDEKDVFAIEYWELEQAKLKG
ncbi:short chain dehydrogenase [Novipirellula aureliae]|uniref:Short chain dehydrogenase n=1 Tax=Novipirellula aureliae TaxID=2527966 RepID=A0A5C6DS53_9BACT|nr:class II aldolase/adducin family protein [Novipirellula aureliae]TWU38717.1 short chain dehydrogenase [Novipirellula aureliae]